MDTIFDFINNFEKLSLENKRKEAEQEIGRVLSILLPTHQIIQTSATHDDGLDFIVKSSSTNENRELSIGVEVKSNKHSISLNDISNSIVRATIQSLNRLVVISSSEFTKSTFDMANKFSPLEIQLYDIKGLRKWASELNNKTEMEPVHLQIAYFVKQLSNNLALLIAQNGAKALETIEWRQLEHIIAEIFIGIGFDAELTPPSKDGGKDVVIHHQGKDYLIEIKHWKAPNRVGSSDLSDFLHVIANEKGHGGLYLSTSGYCSNAFESLKTIDRIKVSYQGAPKIVALTQTYCKVQSGLWSPPQLLPELLYEEVL